MSRTARLASLLTLGALSIAGCSASESARDPGPLRVVTTTAILGEFASEVAGPDAEVVSLIPPGADPHSFEPPTQAARAIAGADVIVVNGYGLEGALLRVVGENRRKSAVVVVAAEGLDALAAVEEEHEEDEAEADAAKNLPALANAEGDPHLWLDPELAARYVERIASALATADATHAEGYRARGTATAARYRALRLEIASALATIPPERRRIVVFHDAFAYFARAFEFQLAAGILPQHAGREPSAGDLAATVALVRLQAVSAIYREPQFSAAIVEALARETGVRVLVLYSDAFGNGTGTPGAAGAQPIEGYEALMRANARALLDGLAPAATR